MSLIKQLESVITNSITNYITKVAEKYSLDENELKELWTETSLQKTNRKNSSETNNSSGEGCPYVYLKGKKQGEICGVKSKDGSAYCSSHKKYEGQETKERKVLPAPKKQISLVKKPATKTENIFLQKNKDVDRLWHAETRLVFQAADKRVVIGKVSEGKKEIAPLTEEDVATCKEWGFKFDKDFETKNDVDSEIDEKEVEKLNVKPKIVKTLPSKSTPNTSTKISDTKSNTDNNTKVSTAKNNDTDTDEDIENAIADIMEDDENLHVKKALGLNNDSDNTTQETEEPELE